MKKATRNAALILLGVAVLIGILYSLVPQGVKMASIAKDIQKDHARFTPGQSVDIAMAMGLVTHEPPRMLNPPSDAPVLLLYPPSAGELARLTGE
jgi:hypothetical protein